MAYSVIYADGDGVNKTFAISFPLGFISRDDVSCRVGAEVDALGDPVYRTLTWITDGLVTISGDAPPVGTGNVAFYRTVSKTTLAHDYQDGVGITESNLDESNKQPLMALHEFLDGRYSDGVSLTDLVQQAEDFANEASGYAVAAEAAAASIELPLPVTSGGTGVTSVSAIKTLLGLGALANLNTVSATQIEDGAVTSAKLDRSAQLPAGTIIDFGSSTPPAGFLACNGSAVSRSTYSVLFSVIRTNYGAGDGSTTFNVPNFAVGFAAIQGTPSGTPSVGQMPAHTHSLPLQTTLHAGSAGNDTPYAGAGAVTGSAGSGTYNLAAGIYVQKCIKY